MPPAAARGWSSQISVIFFNRSKSGPFIDPSRSSLCVKEFRAVRLEDFWDNLLRETPQSSLFQPRMTISSIKDSRAMMILSLGMTCRSCSIKTEIERFAPNDDFLHSCLLCILEPVQLCVSHRQHEWETVSLDLR